MTDYRLRSYGVFLLRLALGTMFLAHSIIYMLMTLTLEGRSSSSLRSDCRLGSPMRPSLPRRSVEYSSFWAFRRDGWHWRSHPS